MKQIRIVLYDKITLFYFFFVASTHNKLNIERIIAHSIKNRYLTTTRSLLY